jgi:hypothetical protein
MIRIMSNNQWWCDQNLPAWKAMGLDCSVTARAPGFAAMFDETLPDLIGLQECSANMAEAHMVNFQGKRLPYALLWGRDTPIIYRSDKFEVIECQSFVYSEDVPGLIGSFNNDKTKSYCVAVLREKATEKLLIFASTHLWWKSEDKASGYYQAGSDEARKYQLNLLMDKLDTLIEKYGCAAMLVGDLNALESSPALGSAFERGYVHARNMATDFVDGGHGMHYCYGDGFRPYEPLTPDHAIDHILVKNASGMRISRFERYNEEYYMQLSDHLPVYVDLEL